MTTPTPLERKTSLPVSASIEVDQAVKNIHHPLKLIETADTRSTWATSNELPSASGTWLLAKFRSSKSTDYRFESNIITLEVGKNKTKLNTHEDAIKAQSPFFTAAVDKKWREGRSRSIPLPEDEVDVVVGYLGYVYSKEITEVLYDFGAISRELLDQVLLAKMYVFGEKIQDDVFCNAVIAKWAGGVDKKDDEGNQWYPISQAVCIIYNGTPENSPARRFLVQMFAQGAVKKFLANNSFPVKFTQDLLCAVLPDRINKRASLYEQRETWFKKDEKKERSTTEVNTLPTKESRAMVMSRNLYLETSYVR